MSAVGQAAAVCCCSSSYSRWYPGPPVDCCRSTTSNAIEGYENSEVLGHAAGCEVDLVTLPLKGHGMVESEQEMLSLMSFWARNLSSRPTAEGPAGADGEEVIGEIPVEMAAGMMQSLKVSEEP